MVPPPACVQDLLENHIRGGIPSSPPASLPLQQYRRHAMPLRGPLNGRVLGIRSFTFTRHVAYSHGAISFDGGPGLGQGLAVLPQGDQHDVRWGLGDRHSRGILPLAYKGSPTRHKTGEWSPDSDSLIF